MCDANFREAVNLSYKIMDKKASDDLYSNNFVNQCLIIVTACGKCYTNNIILSDEDKKLLIKAYYYVTTGINV